MCGHLATVRDTLEPSGSTGIRIAKVRFSMFMTWVPLVLSSNYFAVAYGQRSASDLTVEQVPTKSRCPWV
jgi:hypothetical protein